MTHTGKNGQLTATQEFDSSIDKRVASGIGWLPVESDLVDIEGVSCANTYLPISIEPKEGDVSGWLELCSHIYGEYTDLVLDHLAFSIQFPMTKIRWQILVLGEPRTGKTTTLTPLKNIWGNSVSILSAKELNSGWEDGFVEKKFIVFEEVYNPRNKSFFNDLKTKFSNDDFENLNPKGKGLRKQKNLYSIIMFTNKKDALNFDAEEDKLLVIQAPSERWDPNKYVSLCKMMESADYVSYVYGFLLNRDVSNFPYGYLPERTRAAIKMSESSLPDYLATIGEMIASSEYPFNQKSFSLSNLRVALKNRGYSKFSDKEISEYLSKKGVKKYRGQRKDCKPTPIFWTDHDLSYMTSRELYDWFHNSFHEEAGCNLFSVI